MRDAEFLICANSFMTSLIGSDNSAQWKELFEQTRFQTTVDFVQWLLTTAKSSDSYRNRLNAGHGKAVDNSTNDSTCKGHHLTSLPPHQHELLDDNGEDVVMVAAADALCSSVTTNSSQQTVPSYNHMSQIKAEVPHNRHFKQLQIQHPMRNENLPAVADNNLPPAAAMLQTTWNRGCDNATSQLQPKKYIAEFAQNITQNQLIDFGGTNSAIQILEPKAKAGKCKKQQKDSKFENQEPKDGPMSTCSLCGKLFKYTRNLRKHHLEIHGKHSGERPQCNICGKTYTRPSSVRQHQKIVHKIDDTNF